MQLPDTALQVPFPPWAPLQEGHCSLQPRPKNPLGHSVEQPGPVVPGPHSQRPVICEQEPWSPQWHCSLQVGPHLPAGHWEVHRSPSQPCLQLQVPVDGSQPSEFGPSQLHELEHSSPKLPSWQGSVQEVPV